MTMEERIERLKEKLSMDNKQYDLIGIYEDEHAYKCYGGYMYPWCDDRHMVYPVSWNKEIQTIGSFTGHVSAIFFGTRFLSDDDFEKKVLETLESLRYEAEKIKIHTYQIVNWKGITINSLVIRVIVIFLLF